MASATYMIHRRARPRPSVELWQVRPTTATDPDSMAWTRSFVLESIRESHSPDGPPEGHPLHAMPAYDPSWHAANAESLLPRVELVSVLRRVRRGAGWPVDTDDWTDEADAMEPAEGERFLAERLNTYVLAIEAADPAIFAGLDEVLESHAYDVTATSRPSSTGLHPVMVDAWARSEAAAVVRQRRLTGVHSAALYNGEIVTVDVREDSPVMERWSRTFEPLGDARLRKKKALYEGFVATVRGVYAASSTEIVVWTAGATESLTKKTGHFTGKIQGLVADGEGVWAYGVKEAVRLVGTEVERRLPAPAKLKIRRLGISGDALFLRDEKKLAVVRGDDVVVHKVAPGFELVVTPRGDALLGDQWLAAGESEPRALELPDGWGRVMGAIEVAGRQWLVFQGGAVAEWRGEEGLGQARPLGAMPHFVRGAFAVDDSLILYGSHLVEWAPA